MTPANLPTLIDRLLRCRDSLEFTTVLEDFAATDSTLRGQVVIYCALMEGCSFEPEWKLPQRYRPYQGSCQLREWWEPVDTGTFRAIDSCAYLLFGTFYEDWWDVEACPWGDGEELSDRTWFNAEELTRTLAVLREYGTVITNSDFVLAAMEYSMEELLVNDILFGLPLTVPLPIGNDVRALQLDNMKAIGELLVKNRPTSPPGLELLLLYHQRAADGCPQAAERYWEKLQNAESFLERLPGYLPPVRRTEISRCSEES